jgi:hypothetical protein
MSASGAINFNRLTSGYEIRNGMAHHQFTQNSDDTQPDSDQQPPNYQFVFSPTTTNIVALGRQPDKLIDSFWLLICI